MLTGADGAPTRPGLAGTPPGNLWGVAAAMGAWFVPIGAMRHVAVVWWVPVPPPYPQVHTMCENTPFSRLRTVIDMQFGGSTPVHRATACTLWAGVCFFSSHNYKEEELPFLSSHSTVFKQHPCLC